jgi:homoaconitate hydratase
MVIAATSSQTYKRNAFNNGFIVIECPQLVDDLAERFVAEVASETRTIPGPKLSVDFESSLIACEGKSYRFGALSTTAQELIAAGGSEAVVRDRLGAGA